MRFSLCNRLVILTLALLPFICPLHLLGEAEGRICLHAALALEDGPRAKWEAEHLLTAGAVAELDDARAVIRAYALVDGPSGAWKAYDTLKRFSALSEATEVAEELARAELLAAISSEIESQRAIGLLAVGMARIPMCDALVLRGLEEADARLRIAAVHAAGWVRSAPLFRRLVALFHSERDERVLIEAVRVAALFDAPTFAGELVRLLLRPGLSQHLRQQIWMAMSLSIDDCTATQITPLAASIRAAERELACHLAFALDDPAGSAQPLLPLLNDHNIEVRTLAFQVLAHIASGEERPLLVRAAQRHLSDPHPSVVAAAGYALLLSGKEEGGEALATLLKKGGRERKYATAALGASGQYGVKHVQGVLLDLGKGIEQLSLAKLLLEWRVEEGRTWALDTLRCALSHPHVFWTEESWGLFPIVVPISGTATAPYNAVEQNFELRLAYASLLACFDLSGAAEAVRPLLAERAFGVAGGAMSLLLTTQHETALPALRSLFEEGSPHIRLQAAILLAFWEKSSSALDCLLKEYAGLGFQDKARVLEVLGSLGKKHLIPFLLERIRVEQHPTHRVIAAAALLQLAAA